MALSLSFPYSAPADDPFWGAQTSAVNFCEEDYIVTRYIGEFFNTLTSLIYIYYGFLGILRFRRQNVHPFSPCNYSYWALVGVGVCSGAYHCSLKYHTQMSDELSMHLAIGTVLNQVFTFQRPPQIARRNTLIILSTLIPFVIYHCVADEFILHVVLFFGMTLTVSVKTSRIIKTRITDSTQRRRLSGLANMALASALFGWGLWNIDVHLCHYVTAAKKAVGLPWGALLELHGYWHLFTAIAAYTFMAVIETLTDPGFGLEKDRAGEFAWPAGEVLGEMGPATDVLAAEGKLNGTANGAANGKAHKQ